MAYARNPSKIDFTNDRLTVIKGEITNYEEIRNAMKGCEAVINCLGLSMKPFQKEFPALLANEYIIKAMKELGIKRYITWATPSVKARGDQKSYITVLPPFLAGIMFPKGKKVWRHKEFEGLREKGTGCDECEARSQTERENGTAISLSSPYGQRVRA